MFPGWFESSRVQLSVHCSHLLDEQQWRCFHEENFHLVRTRRKMIIDLFDDFSDGPSIALIPIVSSLEQLNLVDEWFVSIPSSVVVPVPLRSNSTARGDLFSSVDGGINSDRCLIHCEIEDMLRSSVESTIEEIRNRAKVGENVRSTRRNVGRDLRLSELEPR